MTYVYDKSGQRIFFQREGSTYGKVYDPQTSGLTAFTAVPANYAHWRRLDIMEDTFDVPVPFIEKILKYNLEDSKHPSAVLSGNIEPVDITFDMTAQGLEFLAPAIGPPAFTTHDQKMVQTIICIAETAGVVEDDYFLLDVIDSGDDVKTYLIWFNDGTGSAPSVIGIADGNRIEIDLSGGDKSANAIALLLETALEAKDEITAVTVSGANAEITTVAYAGAVLQARNGAASPGFSYSVATWGATKYTITEAIDTNLPSFTIHVEQKNTTQAEDLIYDLFGCVVESITLNMTFGDKLAMYTVVMKCPYGLPGNRSTNNPPRKYIKGFPAMSALQESAENYLLQEKDAYGGTTYIHLDRTPKTVDSVILNITNNVTFKSNISARYKTFPVAGKREISLQVVGNTSEKELFQYFLETFTNDGTDWYPTSASGRLNTVYKIQRDATYDYITIAFYNWLCSEHNFSFVSVDDAVKAVDMTFTDGSSDSNGRLITSMTMVSYIDRTVMVI